MVEMVEMVEVVVEMEILEGICTVLVWYCDCPVNNHTKKYLSNQMRSDNQLP